MRHLKSDSRVPDHAPVLDADLIVALVDLTNLPHAFVQSVLLTITGEVSSTLHTLVGHVPEYGSVRLHGLLHVEPDLRGGQSAIRVPNLVQELDALHASLIGNLLVRLSGSQSVLDVVSASSAEDDDVEERVGAETIGTVNGHAGSFARSIQTRNNFVLAVLEIR